MTLLLLGRKAGNGCFKPDVAVMELQHFYEIPVAKDITSTSQRVLVPMPVPHQTEHERSTQCIVVRCELVPGSRLSPIDCSG